MSMFSKSIQDKIIEAYKVGGLPLGLVILGSLLLTGGVADTWVRIADPQILIASGIFAIVSGSIVDIFRTRATNNVHLALIQLLQETVKGASMGAKTGGDFQAAIRDVAPLVKQLAESLFEKPKNKKQ